MVNLNISNPIFKKLIKLKLVKKNRLKILSKQTRDKKIRVLQDTFSKVIFLEKDVNNKKRYTNKPSSDYVNILKTIKKRKFLDDDKKRLNVFKRFIKNKSILDYGCGFGGFLHLSKKYSKNSEGFEVMKICQNFIKKRNIIKINTKKMELTNKKFDTIFLFHVLEHLSKPVDELIFLRKILKKNGKLVIEVPHALDLLINCQELESFRKFTFWSEHLILHTKESLKKFLINSGFKKIRFLDYQRYNIENHINWFVKNKPNGHKKPLFKIDNKTKKNYEKYLYSNNSTDTLVVVASK
tara:strand:- start:75 stop:962 length:888 start_codon:yes stop_codon:yes gene_type:complete